MKDEFDEQQKRKAERAKVRAEERARLAAAAQTTSSKEEDPAEGEGPNEKGQDVVDGAESHGPNQDEESSTPGKSFETIIDLDVLILETVSPSNRRSWLPSFMSGGSGN